MSRTETAPIERHRRGLEVVAAQNQSDSPDGPHGTAMDLAAEGIQCLEDHAINHSRLVQDQDMLLVRSAGRRE